MTRTLKSGRATEDSEQISLVAWIDAWRDQIEELEMFAAVPNGGKRAQRRNKDGARFSIEAQRLRRMGVSPGYPDTLLDAPVGGFHGLRIELKSTDPKAPTSADQHAWVARLRKRGYACHVCHGWVAAARTIADYLGPAYAFPLPAEPALTWPGLQLELEARRQLKATWMRLSASIPRW